MRATRKTKMWRRRPLPLPRAGDQPEGVRRGIVRQAVRRRGFIRSGGDLAKRTQGARARWTHVREHARRISSDRRSTRAGPQLAPSDPPPIDSIIPGGPPQPWPAGAAPAATTRGRSGRRRHQWEIPCAQPPTARPAFCGLQHFNAVQPATPTQQETRQHPRNTATGKQQQGNSNKGNSNRGNSNRESATGETATGKQQHLRNRHARNTRATHRPLLASSPRRSRAWPARPRRPPTISRLRLPPCRPRPRKR